MSRETSAIDATDAGCGRKGERAFAKPRRG
jgi:hypothetical protein